MPARLTGSLLIGLLSFPAGVYAQSFEILGTRAAGMGGAFVAVADDGSAVYWNPAGLASGGVFSLVLDLNSGEGQATPDHRASSGNSTLVALSTLPLGFSYYRLQTVEVRPSPISPPVAPQPGFVSADVATLTTHHVGVTLVQSLFEGLTVGTTLKLVRGNAGVGARSARELDDLVDAGGDLETEGQNAFDADIGIMATRGRLKAGLTIRNVVEPEFETAIPDESLALERQTRAGIAYQATDRLLIAADVDLERSTSGLGARRNLAVGAEAKVHRKAFVRSGFRFNTVSDQPGGRAPVATVGGSYAVFGSLLVDAQATLGAESGGRGWGVAGRVVF
jgi:long-chain fatty acid transport protein